MCLTKKFKNQAVTIHGLFLSENDVCSKNSSAKSDTKEIYA